MPQPDFTNSNLVLQRGTQQVSCELDGESVLMHLETGEYSTLDDVATEIWNLLEQPQTIEQVICSLTGIFSVDADRCKEDIRPFFEKMAELDLIETTDESV